MRDGARTVGGAKALLRDLIRLGMPRALAADDFLRAMLYGSQSLPDDQQVEERLTGELAWVEELLTRAGAGLSRQYTNVRVVLKQDADYRALALGDALKGYLDALGSGVYSDSLPLVEVPLLTLGMVDASVENSETEKPLVSSPKPAPNSATKGRTPIISATVKDAATNLEKADIQLVIDGRSVSTFAYDQATDRLKYKPRKNLALGKHTVKVTAQDVWGNTTTKQWSFKVVR